MNYPPGTQTNPLAPWNKKECEECDGAGHFSKHEDDDDSACPECKGEGWINIDEDQDE